MSPPGVGATSRLDTIETLLVRLKLSRALEVVRDLVRQLEAGELSALEVIAELLGQEQAARETRRMKAAFMTARLTHPKTFDSFDFSSQPSVDKNRVLALAELGFVERAEVVHVLGPPGTGKSHLATALGFEAVKAGKSVYFATLAEIISSLIKAQRDGVLPTRLRFPARPALLIVDEVGYLPLEPGGANLFFQLVNARYEKGALTHGVDDEVAEGIPARRYGTPEEVGETATFLLSEGAGYITGQNLRIDGGLTRSV